MALQLGDEAPNFTAELPEAVLSVSRLAAEETAPFSVSTDATGVAAWEVTNR